MAMTEIQYFDIVNQVWYQRNEMIKRTFKDPTRIFMSSDLFRDLFEFHRLKVSGTAVDTNQNTMFGIKICRSQDLEYNETHVV